MFKKKQKWFELQGILLEKRWAKNVVEVKPLRYNEYAEKFKEESGADWIFSVTTKDYDRLHLGFPTEEESKSARESLVKWIKEVQS